MNDIPVPEPAAHKPVPLWITLAVCLCASLLVYLPALLHADFLNFDDNLYFGPDNAAFRAGGLAAVLDPRSTIANVYLPVSHLSLYLDWRLFGGDPFGPHLESLLLHALCGVALVRWLLAMRLPSLPAHAVGLLFLVHPALSESVAWVSNRKDLLSGLFAFLALGATARAAFNPTALRLCGIGLLGVLAMYSKATAVVLPVLALLVCLYLRGTDRRRFLAPLVLLLVTLPIAWHHQMLAAAEGTLLPVKAADRVSSVPGAFWHYLMTAFAPVHLNVLYPEASTFDRLRDLLVPGLLLLGLLLVAGHFLWRSRWRPAGLGILLLLVALLPFNTAVPASAVPAADRYLYLAIPGAALLLASLGRPGLVAALLLVVPLGVLCQQRSEAFASSDAVWRASLAADPHNAVACLNLAQDLQRRQQTGKEWRELLERAAADARYPQHAWRAQGSLRLLAMAEGRYEAAVEHAEQALLALDQLPAGKLVRQRRLESLIDLFESQRLCGRSEAAAATLALCEKEAPRHPAVIAMRCQVWLQEAVAAAAAGPGAPKVEDQEYSRQAAAALDTALATDPDDPLINRVAGAWEYARDHKLAALRFFRHVIEVDPTDVEGWVSAAQVLQDSGVYEEAERYARQGLGYRPTEPRLRQLLALSLAAQNRLDDAIVHLEAYVSVRPRDRDAARVLSNLLMGKAIAGFGDKSHAELEALVERALRWNPDEPKVDVVQGRMCREQRKWSEAILHLERAHERLPGMEDVQRMLAESYRDLGYERWGLGTGHRDREGAVEAWLKFLKLAPAEVSTEAVRIILKSEWQRLEGEGVACLRKDRKEAERCFRTCLAIDPSQHWAGWLLALTLYGQPSADKQELERLLQQAVEWQRQHGMDASQQVLLQVLNLKQLGKQDEAERIGREFLAAPGADADADALARLRKALGD
jgi:tetratricopeptide (TPR) repeat protein